MVLFEGLLTTMCGVHSSNRETKKHSMIDRRESNQHGASNAAWFIIRAFQVRALPQSSQKLRSLGWVSIESWASTYNSLFLENSRQQIAAISTTHEDGAWSTGFITSFVITLYGGLQFSDRKALSSPATFWRGFCTTDEVSWTHPDDADYLTRAYRII